MKSDRAREKRPRCTDEQREKEQGRGRERRRNCTEVQLEKERGERDRCKELIDPELVTSGEYESEKRQEKRGVVQTQSHCKEKRVSGSLSQRRYLLKVSLK